MPNVKRPRLPIVSQLFNKSARSAALVLITCMTWAQSAGAAVPLAQLPQQWQDDSGHKLSLSSLGGHRIVITMAYARCHLICPMTMGQLGDMQRAADARGETIEFVVVGYDPKNDKPAEWRQYRRTHELNRDNWYFLTGSVGGTSQLARRLGFQFWKYDDHVIHESRAVLFDSRGLPEAELSSTTKHWDDALQSTPVPEAP
jgi:cytochrome oxidase Cu insertion factor (SCO1/SenC/PrrC family)